MKGMELTEKEQEERKALIKRLVELLHQASNYELLLLLRTTHGVLGK